MSIKEIIAPANFLSFSRIPLAVWVVMLLSSEAISSIRLSVLLMAIAGLTDFLDGIVARWAATASGKENPYGIVFDPVADKIFAIILIGGLLAYDLFPVWLAALILARDVVIIGVGGAFARKYQLVLPSNLPGKYYFAALAFLLAAYVAKFESAIAFLEPLTVALWLLSSWFYVRVFKTILKLRQGVDAGRKSGDEPASGKAAGLFRALAIVSFFVVLLVLFWIDDPLRLW